MQFAYSYHTKNKDIQNKKSLKGIFLFSPILH